MIFGPSRVFRRGLILFGLCGLAACHIVPRERSPGVAGFSAVQGQTRAGEDTSSVLPVLAITVDAKAIALDSETPGTLKVIEDHDGTLKDLPSAPITHQSRISVEIHGESSAGLAKKSYRFELLEDDGESRDLPLLGLPAGSHWVLHSCSADRSCVRNVLAYSLGRELGRYAPRTRFVELVVDDTYRGIYVLLERVRRGDSRVSLPRPAASAADGDITGGYIFKMDLGEGSPGDSLPRDWVSPVTQTIYSYYYPRYNQITAAQKAYLQDHVRSFEDVMQSRLWNDPRTGYRRWIDVPSWVDFALMQELSVNPDAYFKSVYLQKLPQSAGNKIALGPIWDFDLAFGSAEFRDARNTAIWAHKMNRFGTEKVLYSPPGRLPYVPPFWERLWTDAAFQHDVRCRWQDLRQGLLSLTSLNRMIDGWVEQIADAQPRDGALWGNPPANAYAEEVTFLKEFLAKRTAWMDANLPGRCTA